MFLQSLLFCKWFHLVLDIYVVQLLDQSQGQETSLFLTEVYNSRNNLTMSHTGCVSPTLRNYI